MESYNIAPQKHITPAEMKSIAMTHHVSHDALRKHYKATSNIKKAVKLAVHYRDEKIRDPWVERAIKEGLCSKKVKYRIENFKQTPREAYLILKLASIGVDAVFEEWEDYLFSDPRELKRLTGVSYSEFKRCKKKIVKLTCGGVKLG